MDIHKLDLNLLVVLDALFEERRTTRVAERLGMSQPMVSYALGKLRRVFDDDLFYRDGNSMQPTPLAETLRDPVQRVIKTVKVDILRGRQFDPAQDVRRFTLCTSDIGELVFLPGLLDVMRREAPGASIRCVSLPHSEIGARLGDGSIDLVLGYYPDLTEGPIYQQSLFDHPFTILMSADNPLGTTGLDLDAFLAAKHAVVAQEGRSQEIFERKLRELGLTRDVLIQSQHFMSLPHLIARSDMISTVPFAVAQAFCKTIGVRAVEPPIEIPRIPLKQFWHRRMHVDPSLIWLRTTIAKLYLNQDPTLDPINPIFGGPQIDRVHHH